MNVTVGDIVPLTVFRVEAYGLWGTHGGQTGSVHWTDFVQAGPIDEARVPRVGDVVPVRVFHAAPRTEVEYAWGRLVCDFAASLDLVPRHAEPDAAADPPKAAGGGAWSFGGGGRTSGWHHASS